MDDPSWFLYMYSPSVEVSVSFMTEDPYGLRRLVDVVERKPDSLSGHD